MLSFCGHAPWSVCCNSFKHVSFNKNRSEPRSSQGASGRMCHPFFFLINNVSVDWHALYYPIGLLHCFSFFFIWLSVSCSDWNLKYNTNELIYKTETDSQTQRTDLWLPRGRERGGGMEWEFGINRCELVYIGWINDKVLLYSTGTYIQYPVINHNGKKHEKVQIDV